MSVAVPSPAIPAASLRWRASKANSSWIFRRLTLMSRGAYLPLPLPPCGDRSGLRSVPLSQALFTTTPSADFCCAFGSPHDLQSRLRDNAADLPREASIAFGAQASDLRFAPLMDMDFAVSCPLVRRSRLVSASCSSARTLAPRFLQTRLTATPLRFAHPSPPSGWVRTFTF